MLDKIQKQDYKGLEELLKNKVIEVDMSMNDLEMRAIHIVSSIFGERT